MGIAMIGGVFLYGPLDRFFGTRKWVVFCGSTLTLACLFGLFIFGSSSYVLTIIMLCGIGFFGATFPVIIAHGKGFLPAHLTGRGVTLLNMFSIGGVGLAQLIAPPIFDGYQGGDLVTPYNAVFAFFALALVVGLSLYIFSRDNTD
jgi:nitrate/nitrite transporter NarK